jgi:hypothetical protein
MLSTSVSLITSRSRASPSIGAHPAQLEAPVLAQLVASSVSAITANNVITSRTACNCGCVGDLLLCGNLIAGFLGCPVLSVFQKCEDPETS